jgi:tetratricopeptide (TPR) repeat protein
VGHAAGLSALKAGLFSKLGFAKQCKAAYDKAVELDPKNIEARWSLMEYCRQAPGFLGGGMDQAYVQAEAIKKIDARKGTQAYGNLYVADKKYADAFALYENVLREKPGDWDALYNIGRIAAISGEQLDRGLAALHEYLEKDPKGNHARTYTRIGNILEKKGDKPGARAAYEAALKTDPKFSQASESLSKL